MKINSISLNTQYKANNYSTKSANNQSFKGDETQSLKGVSKFLANTVYPNVEKTKPFQWLATQLSKTDKSFTALLVAESVLLSGFYMINTVRNKKIKKEQKPQMLINDALTLGVSSAGAIFLDGKINKLVSTGTEKYINNRKDFYRNLAVQNGVKNPINELLTQVGDAASKTGEALKQGAQAVSDTIGKDLKSIVATNPAKQKTFQISKETLENVQNEVKQIITEAPSTAKEVVGSKVKELYSDMAARVEADKFAAGMSKVKTLIIFGIIYRYIGPVVVTPLANKLSSKFFGNKKDTPKTQQIKK